jgi:hypothetical protein
LSTGNNPPTHPPKKNFSRYNDLFVNLLYFYHQVLNLLWICTQVSIASCGKKVHFCAFCLPHARSGSFHHQKFCKIRRFLDQRQLVYLLVLFSLYKICLSAICTCHKTKGPCGRCPKDAVPSLWLAECAAQKTAATIAARFGSQIELDEHGRVCGSCKWGSKANTRRNCGAEGVARRGIRLVVNQARHPFGRQPIAP